MRILDRYKAEYETKEYDPDVTVGENVAELIGNDPERTFKTLVTVSDKGLYFVFVVPVTSSLDLKKAAKCVGAKSVAMIKQKDLLPLTGYVHGGCSPFGMKKQFPTFVHESAQNYGRIAFSAGRRGLQVITDPQNIINIVKAQYKDLVSEEKAEEEQWNH